MTDLGFRIDMLEQSGQITGYEASCIRRMIDLFAGEWGIALNEDNAGMFITHFAIALKRAREGDAVAMLSGPIFAELEQSAAFGRSLLALGKIEKLFGYELPPAEKGYVLLHLNKYFAG